MKRVIVVGAGLVGLSSAYFARLRGADVVVLDRRTVGAGASSGNAGWLAPSLSAPLPGPGMARAAMGAMLSRDGAFRISATEAVTSLPWLWRFHRHSTPDAHRSGLEAMARLAHGSLDAYDEMVADGVQVQMADTGLLYVARNQARAVGARHALAPLAAIGMVPGDVLSGASLARIEPSLTGAGLSGFLVPQDRSVDPSSMLSGIEKRLAQMGVVIHGGVTATGVITGGRRVEGVETSRGPFRGDTVILAAGARTGELARKFGLRLPMRAGTGYSFAVVPQQVPKQPLYLLEAKVAVTPLPRRVRVTGGFDLTGNDPKPRRTRIQAVASAASDYAEWAAGPRTDPWVGSRPVLPDGLPAVGPVPFLDGLHINSGHAMLGVTLAANSGKLLVESIVGDSREDSVLSPFSPTRFDSRRRPGRRGITTVEVR